MKVEVVGTSCNWFSRHNTSFIIDDKILFDVPGGNYKQIIKSVDVLKLDWIFISHLHDDHVADLKIITTRFIRENYIRNKKLKIYGPKGLAEFIVKVCGLFFGGDDELDFDLLKSKIEFVEIYDGMEFTEGKYNIKVKKMNHGRVECYGLIFEDKAGKVISFSADTLDCQSLHEMLEVSNYAFVDMAASKPSRSHLTNIEFVELEKKYKSCKMFPVHTNDECQEFAIKNKLNYLEDGQLLDL